MDLSEWLARLDSVLTSRDVGYQTLRHVLEKEERYGADVSAQYQPHQLITDCFFSFYMETLHLTAALMRGDGASHLPAGYPSIFLIHVTNLRSLRAADIAFMHGYPLDGVALLRDLKDRALLLAAIAAHTTSLEAWLGPMTTPGHVKLSDGKRDELRKRRIREERGVFDLMLRSKCGLPEEAKRQLKRWEQLFHSEVHGSMLTMAHLHTEWDDTTRLGAWPTLQERPAAMYMNRSAEVHWMVLRTLPFLQLAPRAFGEKWADDWTVLDESFRIDVEALGKLGKPIKRIVAAVIKLLDEKLAFSPDCHYLGAPTAANAEARRRQENE